MAFYYIAYFALLLVDDFDYIIQIAQGKGMGEYNVLEERIGEKYVLRILFGSSRSYNIRSGEYPEWYFVILKGKVIEDRMKYLQEKWMNDKKYEMEKISIKNQKELERYIEGLKLRGYSPGTIRTYTNEFRQLLSHLKGIPVTDLTEAQLRSYLLHCTEKLKLSENLIHSRLNALKFYFEKILCREKYFTKVPRPKKRNSLPKTLNQKEIKKVFEVVENKKHLVLLKLCYGMGLRVSELVNLEISDVDSERRLVHVRNSKNKEDRYVALPESILEELREYYKEYRPKRYLFEGQNPDTPYSIRSVQQVFKNALKKAKIKKKIGIHGLRHSYATHLSQYGTDPNFIQQLSGHSIESEPSALHENS